MRFLTDALPYHPNMVLRKVNSLYHTRLGRHDYCPRGIDIFDEDWDNLVILDACRNDLFESTVSLSGRTETKISRGSNTSEFLRGNCTDRDLTDVVYVTASPIYYYHREEINATFHEVIHVWDEDGWDKEVGTVLPETTTEYAIDAYEAYPNKRLLVHYIQPHYPFIDSDTEFDKKHLHDDSEKEVSFWREMNTGKLSVSPEHLSDLFRENLERALPHVRELVQQIEGRTVITSDHGNMYGERLYPVPIRHWGHPPQLYTDPLVKVPWLVREEEEERKEIVSDENSSDDRDFDDGAVEERLEHLGYVDL